MPRAIWLVRVAEPGVDQHDHRLAVVREDDVGRQEADRLAAMA